MLGQGFFSSAGREFLFFSTSLIQFFMSGDKVICEVCVILNVQRKISLKWMMSELDGANADTVLEILYNS